MRSYQKIFCRILPIFLLLEFSQQVFSAAYMKNVRIEEIPFGLSRQKLDTEIKQQNSGLQLIAKWEQKRSFFHIFHVPYILCFFAAKGKWPFITPLLQPRIDAEARSFFKKNDTFIKNFCKKWIQIKECIRPIFDNSNDSVVVDYDALSGQRCNCNKLVADGTPVPVVYFDKNYIGNVSSDTILNTIEFLESFLPPPTKKQKRKNRVRGRIDNMDIE